MQGTKQKKLDQFSFADKKKTKKKSKLQLQLPSSFSLKWPSCIVKALRKNFVQLNPIHSNIAKKKNKFQSQFKAKSQKSQL
jgi:hypothetical protein